MKSVVFWGVHFLADGIRQQVHPPLGRGKGDHSVRKSFTRWS